MGHTILNIVFKIKEKLFYFATFLFRQFFFIKLLNDLLFF